MNAQQAVHACREVTRRQHKSLATEDSYTGWLRRYMRAIRQMPNEIPAEQKLERFLSELAGRDVSASTQNQAFSAILFFYKDVLKMPLKNVDALRATRGAHLRHAPSVEEVRSLLDTVRDVAGYPTHLISRLLYGCGLRVSEPLNLRIKDVELAEGRLAIMAGKGRKDRVVGLPCALTEEIRGQIEYARHIWKQDERNQIPVEIPHQLAKKFPEARTAWPWAWLFPAHRPCCHPHSGETVRYRMHEANVQRAIKYARRKLGIMVLPHELRHAFATHCLNGGQNPRAIQLAMGHASLETTMGYMHAEALSLRSPLDAFTPAQETPLPLIFQRA